MGTVLDEIVAYKREFVAQAKSNAPLAALKARATSLPETKDFAGALCRPDGVAIIAEIKKASPSRGVIREDFDPGGIARIYEANGAAAISVLTDEKYFQGSTAHLRQARQAVELPLLRKDFVVDAYQIHEARAIGADAVLLVAAILDTAEMSRFLELCCLLGLDALVEIHSSQELEKALAAQAEIIGINNRDLRTFETDLSTTTGLLPLVPKGKVVVSESGICNRRDIEELGNAGVNAVLIGEALMGKEDIGEALRAFGEQHG